MHEKRSGSAVSLEDIVHIVRKSASRTLPAERMRDAVAVALGDENLRPFPAAKRAHRQRSHYGRKASALRGAAIYEGSMDAMRQRYGVRL